MAAINSGQNVSAAWEAYVGLDPTDNIFKRHWILEQMRQNGSFQKQNGTVIRHNLEYATNPNAKFMSEMETVTVFRPDTFDNAEYSWKLIGGDVPMTDLESAIVSGGASKYDLQARKLQNLKNTMEELCDQSFFSDGTNYSSKEFGGIQLLVSTSPSTGTIGLINRATYSFFRNQQTSGAKTTNAYDNLLSSGTTIYNLSSNGIGEENPTYSVTDLTTFGGYEAQLVSIERLVRDGEDTKGVRGFKGQNIAFKDIPVGFDPFCPNANWYFLNNRNLFFVYMQWMKGEPAVRPSDGFWDVFKVLTIGNMTTDNPRRLGVVSSIT